MSKSFFNKENAKEGTVKIIEYNGIKWIKWLFLPCLNVYCLYPQQYKSKRVHVSKYKHFSDYWLRTSAVIHVYKARARRNGTGCLFQFTYCGHSMFLISVNLAVRFHLYCYCMNEIHLRS